MKQIISLTVLLLGLILGAFAQSGPKMEFQSTTIDYGTIEHNADGYRVFKFKNTGDEPLVISHAQGSCGCTVPEYSTTPVLPGKTGEIKVRYATDRIGVFQKTVTLTTNSVPSVVVLTIKGEVNAPATPAATPTTPTTTTPNTAKKP